jgi:hypothetical protein
MRRVRIVRALRPSTDNTSAPGAMRGSPDRFRVTIMRPSRQMNWKGSRVRPAKSSSDTARDWL